MDLSLDLPSELIGKAPLLSVGEPIRLNQEDLNKLALDDSGKPTVAPLRSIRQAHHMLARMLADNVPIPDISATLGYSPSHIRQLESDPALEELITHYRSRAEMEQADIHSQIQLLGLAAMQELRNRLDSDPDDFSTGELMKMFESMMDRSGHGPQSKVQLTTINPLEIIKSMKAQIDADSRGRILSRSDIDAGVILDQAETEISELGETPNRRSLSGPEVNGIEGEGNQLSKTA